MDAGDYRIIVRPTVKSDKKAALREINFLGTRETVVEYPDTFGPGVHLQYLALGSGLKDIIYLEHDAGISDFSFELELNGLIPGVMEGMAIPLLDEQTGEQVCSIGQPYAKDSYVGENPDCEEHLALDHSYTVEKVSSGKYLLHMHIDEAFLSRESTVYPVMIDPTITMSRTTMKDTSVYSKDSGKWHTSAWNMVGTHKNMGVGYAYIQTTRIRDYRYINPDRISSVKYHVYEGSGTTHSSTICAYPVPATWTDSSITYQNRPKPVESVLLSKISISSSKWYDFDITRIAPLWLDYELGNNTSWQQGMGFALQAENGTKASKHFASADNTSQYQPSLKITYSEDNSLQDGYYFIRNKKSGHYLDTELNASANGNCIQYKFHGGTNQRWRVVYQGDGLYKLHSVHYNNAKCLSMNKQTGNIDVFDNVGTCESMKFRIVRCHNGTYRIMPTWGTENFNKAVETQDASTASPYNVQLWNYNGGPQQQWVFETEKRLSTPHRVQEKTNWCWAASAQMLARTYVPGSTHTQTQIVQHVMGEVVDKPAGEKSTRTAAEYASNNTVAFDYKMGIFSEKDLMRKLHAGHPVAVNRVSSRADGTGNSTGHIMVLYGYKLEGKNVRLLIQDPAPNPADRMTSIDYETLKWTTSGFLNTECAWMVYRK